MSYFKSTSGHEVARARITEAVATIGGVQSVIELLEAADLSPARKTNLLNLLDDRLESVAITLMMLHDDLSSGGGA